MERGPAHTFEVIHQSGHVDRFDAHQVSYPTMSEDLFDRPYVDFHGEVDGRWMHILRVRQTDIVTIRNLTVLGEVNPLD